MSTPPPITLVSAHVGVPVTVRISVVLVLGEMTKRSKVDGLFALVDG